MEKFFSKKKALWLSVVAFLLIVVLAPAFGCGKSSKKCSHEGVGTCAKCEESFFDIAVDYIKDEGEYEDGEYDVSQSISSTQFISISYDGNTLEFNVLYKSVYLFQLKMKNSLGVYEYMFYDGNSSKYLEGTIYASLLTDSTAVLAYSSTNYAATVAPTAAELAKTLLDGMIVAVNSYCELEELSFTMYNFGFVNY